MIASATIIGLVVMVSGGFALAALFLAGAGWVTGLAGAWLFRRLRRTYNLYTIGYYLAELEEKGNHKFSPPDIKE